MSKDLHAENVKAVLLEKKDFKKRRCQTLQNITQRIKEIRGNLKVQSFLKNFIYGFTDLFFPKFCVVCKKPIVHQDNHICEECLKSINISTDRCPVCSGSLENGECVFCSERKVYIDRNICCFDYEGVIKKLMAGYKFSGYKRISKVFGSLFYNSVNDFPKGDIITSVPMTKKKIWKRGYNQSEIFAKELGKLYKLKYLKLLSESKEALVQRELNFTERFFNILGRYTVLNKSHILGKSIILADDVFTTGATINECARVLKEAGADKVFSVTIARSIIKSLKK
jgi:ComF family protein